MTLPQRVVPETVQEPQEVLRALLLASVEPDSSACVVVERWQELVEAAVAQRTWPDFEGEGRNPRNQLKYKKVSSCQNKLQALTIGGLC